MPIELECKLNVAEHESLRTKLRAAGATHRGRVLETNLLFDNQARQLMHTGCGLRVRTVRPIDAAANAPIPAADYPPAEPGAGGADAARRPIPSAPGSAGGQSAHPEHAATLTFKGPLQRAAFKQREEIEFSLPDAEGAVRLLEALGYAPWLTFEKRRETWSLGSCKIELDELPKLGCFIEVEGPAEADIRAVLTALGLDAAKSITRSYAAMIVERTKARETPVVLRFIGEGE